MIRFPLPALILGAAVLVVSGCAATPAPTPTPTAKEKPASPEVSRIHDCLAVAIALEDTATALSSMTLAAAGTDPVAMLRTFEEAAAALHDASAEISDDELRAATEDAGTALAEYVESLEPVLTDPASADISLITDRAAELQESMEAMSALCS